MTLQEEIPAAASTATASTATAAANTAADSTHDASSFDGEARSLAARLPSSRWTLPAVAAVGGLALFEILRERFQRSQMFCPTRFPDGQWDPQNHGVPAEDVWFDTEDGVRLHGWWIGGRRADERGERAVIVYCHGNAGSLGDRMEVIRELSKLGADLFAFDYRGYGRSEGSPSAEGVAIDACTAVDYVVAQRGAQLEQVVLFGHSLGGAVAVEGAKRRDVAGLIVQSSFTDIISMAREYFPSGPLHLAARNYLPSVETVPELKMPKLFLHGTADETVPYEHGRRLFAAAAGPKTFISVPGGMHNDLHIVARDVWYRAGRRFLHRCLTSPRTARA